MKIITEPTVYLVGKPKIEYDGADDGADDHPKGLQDFLDDHNIDWLPAADNPDSQDGEDIPEIAGRLCYMSYDNRRPGGNAAYLKHILEVGHGSVLEHTTYNFIITGISRSCSHELVRHRAGWAYSQLSQRYVDESVAEYVCPDVIAKNRYMFEQWKNTITQVHSDYCSFVNMLAVDILGSCPNCDDDNPTIVGAKVICNKCQQVRLISTEQRKAARQAARSVLPNATETKIFASANVRAIRHFIELRASRHAEPEIRKVANRIWAIMKQEAPSLFGDYTMSPLPDGTYEVVTLYRKV